MIVEAPLAAKISALIPKEPQNGLATFEGNEVIASSTSNPRFRDMNSSTNP